MSKVQELTTMHDQYAQAEYATLRTETRLGIAFAHSQRGLIVQQATATEDYELANIAASVFEGLRKLEGVAEPQPADMIWFIASLNEWMEANRQRRDSNRGIIDAMALRFFQVDADTPVSTLDIERARQAIGQGA